MPHLKYAYPEREALSPLRKLFALRKGDIGHFLCSFIHYSQMFRNFSIHDSNSTKKRKLERTSFTALRCIPRKSDNRDFSYQVIREKDDTESVAAAEDAVSGAIESVSYLDRSGPDSKVTFTREMLDDVQVIGQFDQKFIICRMRYPKDGRPLLVAFDQHAVHERIRLEHLYKERRVVKSSKMSPSLKASLASKACKTAIRFGDKLSNEKCKMLIDGLRDCVHPFQCAHGRPSVVPLLKMPEDFVNANVSGETPVVID